MTASLTVVDAFTDRPFAGNPAAVCLLGQWPDDAWLAAVATEMNLSETAYVVRRPGGGGFDLRWFTPAVEVDLCGHATLAAAHVLFGRGAVAPGSTVTFHTRSGALVCSGGGGWIEMDFPALPPKAAPRPSGIERALGTGEQYAVARSRFDLLVEVADAGMVRALRPDIGALRSIEARGVIVTAPGDRDGIDCVSRFFAPRVGVEEDPVTGSAHCVLAPFWSERTGRTDLVGEQASRRGGTVRMRLAGDRVALGGRAVTVAEVTMLA